MKYTRADQQQVSRDPETWTTRLSEGFYMTAAEAAKADLLGVELHSWPVYQRRTFMVQRGKLRQQILCGPNDTKFEFVNVCDALIVAADPEKYGYTWR